VAPHPRDLAERTNAATLRRLLPRHAVVSFPYLVDPGHIPALVNAARSCNLLSLLPIRVS
jgi:hypothetical protein